MQQRQKILIGLTGGICTGKTTVANIFASQGINVIDVDEISRSLLKKGAEGYLRVIKAFGKRVLRGEEIDRKRLAAIVFDDTEQRKKLELVIHPLIEEAIEEKVKRCCEGEIVIDSPLLIERGDHEKMDFVIVVYTPEPLQIERMIKRDGLTREDALKRLKAQLPLSEKIASAHYIVDNSRDIEYTREQVLRVLADIRKKASRGRRDDGSAQPQ